LRPPIWGPGEFVGLGGSLIDVIEVRGHTTVVFDGCRGDRNGHVGVDSHILVHLRGEIYDRVVGRRHQLPFASASLRYVLWLEDV
jgi:hypothetical protein